MGLEEGGVREVKGNMFWDFIGEFKEGGSMARMGEVVDFGWFY